jgi:hypothetical protein
MVVELAQRSAPEKKIVWLGDHVYSRPSTSNGRASMWSAGERLANSLSETEVLTADMVIIDDVIGVLDRPTRSAFWKNLTELVLPKIPVVLTLSTAEMLPDDGTAARRSLLERAATVLLDSTSIAAEQAAAELRALDANRLPQKDGLPVGLPAIPDQSPAPVRIEERDGRVSLLSTGDSALAASEADFESWREPVLDHIQELLSGDFRQGTIGVRSKANNVSWLSSVN